MRPFLLSLLALASLASSSPTLSTSRPITLEPYPAVSMAPAWVEIRVGVYPDVRNRGLIVVVEGDDYVSSTYKAIEGLDGPKRFNLMFKDLPGGDYEVRAEVLRSLHPSLLARGQFVVSSPR